MKAISLWQPWASLWLTSAKLYETRSWSTDYRGQLLVHAAKKRVHREQLDPKFAAIVLDELGPHWEMDIPYGALLGYLAFIDCVPTESLRSGHVPHGSMEEACGNFEAGRFAWKRGPLVRRFKEPILYKGRQHLFDVPEHVYGGHLVEEVHA